MRNNHENSVSKHSGRELSAKEQPYERFLSSGPESLTNAELIGVILRTGTRGVTAVELGRKILSVHGEGSDSLSSLPHLTMKELRAIPGIGEVKAVKILCLSEIARRIVKEKIRRVRRFDSPDSIAEYFMEEMRHLNVEKTIVLHMDSKMNFLGEDLLTIGTVNGALLSAREIYLKALERQAVQIVLLHNHPSGDPTPSREDIETTGQIRRAGELLGIRLADHIIIGDLCYTSFREMGYFSDEITEF